MIDAILNTRDLTIIMRIVYNMKLGTLLIKSSGELAVVTGPRTTVIDASEHALGLNTPSRGEASTHERIPDSVLERGFLTFARLYEADPCYSRLL